MRNLDSCRCWRCKLRPCKVRNKFLVNFSNHTILLCIPCTTCQSNTTIFFYYGFYYLGQHVSILIESSSGPSKIQFQVRQNRLHRWHTPHEPSMDRTLTNLIFANDRSQVCVLALVSWQNAIILFCSGWQQDKISDVSKSEVTQCRHNLLY